MKGAPAASFIGEIPFMSLPRIYDPSNFFIILEQNL
jgi:hypothetical protein